MKTKHRDLSKKIVVLIYISDYEKSKIKFGSFMCQTLQAGNPTEKKFNRRKIGNPSIKIYV